MGKILPFLLIVSLFITPVLADTQNYCADNTTLVKISTTKIDVPELGVSRTINSTENETCQYNCDMTHNVCYNDPSSNWLKAIFIILGVALLSWLILVLFR